MLKTNACHPIMISGLEGCWSTIITAFICMPIAQYLQKAMESMKIKKSAALSIFVVIIFLLGFIYSLSSITLIQRTSAVTRTLWEAFRTFLIWIVQFIIFYSFKTNNFLYPYRLAGEDWVNGSYVKLIGFIILICGICCYHKIPKYPCFSYKDEKEIQDQCEETCENTKVALSPLIDNDKTLKLKQVEDDDSISSDESD